MIIVSVASKAYIYPEERHIILAKLCVGLNLPFHKLHP